MGLLEDLIRALTATALGGLVFSAGLQLQWREVVLALRRCPRAKITVVNFLAIPALAFGLVRWLKIPSDIASGILLLGAAPFAPVVPTFTRMARGDLALAAALTGLMFPALSVFLTPLICAMTMEVRFNFAGTVVLLLSTVTLPLVAGMTLNHFFQKWSARVAKGIQAVSEGAGAIGLILVVCAEFRNIAGLGWKPLLAVGLLSELSFLAGWICGGSDRPSRIVIAFGSSNRNIALALMIAAQSFPTTVMGSVAGCGLVLILLGLAHVAWLRFMPRSN